MTNIDQTGVPVTLNLNSKGVHQTAIGGCCSLIVTILSILIVVSQWIKVFSGEEFSSEFQSTYIHESTELQSENKFEIPTEDLIPAILIHNRFVDKDVNILNYL